MTTNILKVTIWDVGRGISVWAEMPGGDHHWIDLGRLENFSPSRYTSEEYGVNNIDYLIISHPDKDHVEDISSFLDYFGSPRVIRRNKSLPRDEKYGSGRHDYQKKYMYLDKTFNSDITWNKNPMNPKYNGGVEYIIRSLDYGEVVDGCKIEGNNTSEVVMMHYKGLLICFPGDIEPLGWKGLWSKHGNDFKSLINKSNWRILVAPHHGRKTTYCPEMMDAIKPSTTIINDVWGESKTHRSYREKPGGIRYKDGSVKKYFSTKREGRVLIKVSESRLVVNQFNSD